MRRASPLIISDPDLKIFPNPEPRTPNLHANMVMRLRTFSAKSVVSRS